MPAPAVSSSVNTPGPVLSSSISSPRPTPKPNPPKTTPKPTPTSSASVTQSHGHEAEEEPEPDTLVYRIINFLADKTRKFIPFKSEPEPFIGPEVPYLHGPQREQKIIMYSLLAYFLLRFVAAMGAGTGFMIATAFFLIFLVGSTLVLYGTSKVAVGFTRFQNCANILLIACLGSSLLLEFFGESIFKINTENFDNFWEGMKKESFKIHAIFYTMFALFLTLSGRLVWGRNFRLVLKALVILLVLTAIYMLIVSPLLFNLMIDAGESTVSSSTSGGSGGVSIPSY